MYLVKTLVSSIYVKKPNEHFVFMCLADKTHVEQDTMPLKEYYKY